ncbi:MAG: hypothetical protein HKM04_04825, partial [Legionellales bacterium]|nr:hypothetical protein [Legionellales bacterium]
MEHTLTSLHSLLYSFEFYDALKELPNKNIPFDDLLYVVLNFRGNNLAKYNEFCQYYITDENKLHINAINFKGSNNETPLAAALLSESWSGVLLLLDDSRVDVASTKFIGLDALGLIQTSIKRFDEKKAFITNSKLALQVKTKIISRLGIEFGSEKANALIQEDKNSIVSLYYYLGFAENGVKFAEEILNLPDMNLNALNFQDESGMSQLHLACEKGEINIVRKLLEFKEIDTRLTTKKEHTKCDDPRVAAGPGVEPSRRNTRQPTRR